MSWFKNDETENKLFRETLEISEVKSLDDLLQTLDKNANKESIGTSLSPQSLQAIVKELVELKEKVNRLSQ